LASREAKVFLSLAADGGGATGLPAMRTSLRCSSSLRRKPSGKHVFLYAFDLLELDGEDLRREPLETRKATLASLLRRSLPGAAPERAPRPRWRERILARLQDGP